MRAGSLKRFALDLYNGISNHNVFNGAAAIACYLFLSLFSSAIILLSLLPYMPIPHLKRAIMGLLGQALPEQSADMFTGIVSSIGGMVLLAGPEVNILYEHNHPEGESRGEKEQPDERNAPDGEGLLQG